VSAAPPVGSILWRFYTPSGEWIDRPAHTAVVARNLARIVLGDDIVMPPVEVPGPVREGVAPPLPEQPRRRRAARKPGRMVGAERGART
jgi:hypothetical protein